MVVECGYFACVGYVRAVGGCCDVCVPAYVIEIMLYGLLCIMWLDCICRVLQ